MKCGFTNTELILYNHIAVKKVRQSATEIKAMHALSQVFLTYFGEFRI